jgi:hypothetical protein
MNQDETSLLRKIIFLSIAILAAVLSVARVKPAFAQIAPANFDAVDDYISTRMKELGIPGAALVIVQGDQIVHLKAFGVADADGRLVTPQTPFFTGSTGKSFTALAIMQLVEAGKINLDAPVQTYLPWFRVADANASEFITVRQLLNMDSGIPRSVGQEQIANLDLSDSAIENNVRALAKIDLIARPGQRYAYSNANYVTLGMLIQAACFTALTLIWNVVVAYILLVLLPVAFNSGLRTVILFQPDVGWMAVMSGIVAMIWAVISSSIGISMMRHTFKRPEMAQRLYFCCA